MLLPVCRLIVCPDEGPNNINPCCLLSQNVVYATFKEAAIERSLLADDSEYHRCMEQASLYAMAPQLRQLFAQILLKCELKQPAAL